MKITSPSVQQVGWVRDAKLLCSEGFAADFCSTSGFSLRHLSNLPEQGR